MTRGGARAAAALAAALAVVLAPQGQAQGNPAQERELEELPEGLLDDEVARLAVRAEIERPQLYLVEVVFLRNRDSRSSNAEFFSLQEYGDQLRMAVRLPLPQELDEYRSLSLPPLSPLPPPPGTMGRERMLQVLREAMAAERRARDRAGAASVRAGLGAAPQAQTAAGSWGLDRAPLPCRGMFLRHCPGPFPADPKMKPAAQPAGAGGQETADDEQGEGPPHAQSILGEIAAVLPEDQGAAAATDGEGAEAVPPQLPDVPYARAPLHSDRVQDLIARVQASSSVTLLSSYAWVQHLPPPRGAPNVLLPPLSESLSEPEQRVEDEYQPLHGFVRVYRSRFRHLVMDLRLRSFLPATEELMQTLGLAPEAGEGGKDGQNEGQAREQGAEGQGLTAAEAAKEAEDAEEAGGAGGQEETAEAAKAEGAKGAEGGAAGGAKRKLAQLSGAGDLPVYLDWSHRLKGRMREQIAREKEAGGEVVEEVISTEGVELQFLEGWERSWRPDKIAPPDFGLPARPEGVRFHRVPRGHLLWESYALQESRRIDDDSLHYFDHPRFGAFARITPIEEVSFPTDGDDTASSP